MLKLNLLYDNMQSACGVHYSFMHKSEEIMCDLVAARVVPHGGQKGAFLYCTKLEKNGNRNGVKGDHPYTKTRIWYHDALSKIEQL